MPAREEKESLSPVLEIELLRNAAWDPRLPRGAIAVYHGLLKHSDANGDCWPGFRVLAKLANLTRQSVQENLIRLESFGYMAIDRGTKGAGWKYHLYQTKPYKRPKGALKSGRLVGSTGLAQQASSSGLPQQATSAPTDWPSAVAESGLAQSPKVAYPARPELAPELTSRTHPVASREEEQEQKRSPEELARHIAICRQSYMQARNLGATALIQQLEERYREHLGGLMEGAAA